MLSNRWRGRHTSFHKTSLALKFKVFRLKWSEIINADICERWLVTCDPIFVWTCHELLPWARLSLTLIAQHLLIARRTAELLFTIKNISLKEDKTECFLIQAFMALLDNGICHMIIYNRTFHFITNRGLTSQSTGLPLAADLAGVSRLQPSQELVRSYSYPQSILLPRAYRGNLERLLIKHIWE